MLSCRRQSSVGETRPAESSQQFAESRKTASPTPILLGIRLRLDFYSDSDLGSPIRDLVEEFNIFVSYPHSTQQMTVTWDFTLFAQLWLWP